MLRSRHFAVLMFGLVLSASGLQSAWAQGVSAADVTMGKEAAAPRELSQEQIQARLEKAEQSKDLEEAVRSALVETYKKILAQIKSGEEFSAKAAAFQKATMEAPAQLTQARAELEAPAKLAPEIDANLPLAQLQQSLTQAETRLADLQKVQTDLQTEPKRRADRRVEIPKLQDAARKVLTDIELQRAAKPPADENAEVTEANRLLLDARKYAADQELSAYDQELRFYESTSELITVRRDLAVVQLGQAEQAVKAWRMAVNERRRLETEQQAREALRATLQAHPSIRQLAQDNANLIAERKKLAEKIESISRDSDASEKRLATLDAEFARIMDRVKRVGLTQAIGLLLRKQRESLPSVELRRNELEARQAEISRTSLELVDLEDQRAALADVDSRAEELVTSLLGTVNRAELPLIEDDVRQLLQTKRGYLESLIADTSNYLDKLVEYDTRDRQLISKTSEYAAFTDEYILWIQSTDLLQVSDVASLWQAIRWLIAPASWRAVGEAIATDAMTYPLMYLLGAILLPLLLYLQRTWKRLLREAGQEASKSFTISFRPTATALLVTILMSITWPAVFWVVGDRLSHLGDGSEFVNAVGDSLRTLALLLLTLSLARHICAGGGLGESHFGWPIATLRPIRQMLRLLMIIGLPVAFVVLMMEAQSSENYRRSLGRVGFLAGQILLALGARQVWLATETMGAEKSKRGSWFWSTSVRRVWYVVTVGTPLVLGGLAVLGYYYTAMQLESRLIATIWLSLGLVIVHSTLMRGLLMAYRDLAIRRAKERRASEAAAAAAATATGIVGAQGAEVNIVPEPTFKLSDINEQTKKLVRMAMLVALFVGFGLIWVEVLPALRVLRRVEIWPQPFHILEAINSDVTPGTLTLADAILASMIALVTFAATRNLPGLLEMTVLRQLTIDSGARYAITAVCRYVITVLGIILAVGQLGIAWTHVQWLVAAVSVGLGFGLQEIFANFVSGLILLFERPIRIGDVVSVGDVTGKVTRIRIRATTITDWDMRELVVPNREFITSRVMNWTLTDTLARMTLKVGVAYGTDPHLPRKLLLEVAEKNSNVLKEPPPHALCDEFGESTMIYTLRVYLPSLDVFLQTRHELHAGISHAFRTAGIEIAFPQRDIHIRSGGIEDFSSVNGDAESGKASSSSTRNG